MSSKNVLSSSDFDNLRKLDTCTVSNTIDRFNVRLQNEGFVSSTVRCQFPNFEPMLGYAVTARVQTSWPPMTGRFFNDNMDWWNYVASMPSPKVIVLQDADHMPGFGGVGGEIHSAIALALNCVGQVTNGVVRDLPAVEAMGFHLFASGVSVSHAYAHIVEFGEPVEIGGLKILPGDLLHGDRHGVHKIPLSIAPEIPQAASRILSREHELVEFCRSHDFSLPELATRLQKMSGKE